MLGEKIINERKNHKLSQEELSEMVGVTRQTISNWELNETSPDLKQAQKLADIFNISIDELIGKKNVLLEKVDKTESNSNLIIKLIKILGITLGTLIFILLCVVCIYLFTINYYKSELTASGEGRICYYNGKISNYVIMKNNADGSLSFDIEDLSIVNEFNLSNVKTGEPKEILDKIVVYIQDNGGVCLDEN
ncbi:MAG: helix-turn-helix transcriptional regulator [bacterium]|nr:helix-turn-helix transcriptional regulator [bacterium]